MNSSELAKMSVVEKLQIVNNLYVSYPRSDEILTAIEYCHRFSYCQDEPECMFFSGETGVGKTTIYKTYAIRYPRQVTRERTIVPILAGLCFLMKEFLTEKRFTIGSINMAESFARYVCSNFVIVVKFGTGIWSRLVHYINVY